MASLTAIILVLAVFAAAYYFFKSAKSQFFGYFPYQAKTERKTVALTFDDGPNPPHTQKLLDVLQKHRVKATFFIVGKNLEKYPEVAKKIIEQGHTIGNHSYSHSFAKNFSEPGFENEIQQAQAVIQKLLAKKPALFRPPWLMRNPLMLRNLKRIGMLPISGLFGSELEVLQVSPEKMANRALKKIKPGMILIFHDGFDAHGGNRTNTVEAIDLLIPKIKSEGYELATVDELLKVPAYQ